MGGRTGLFGAVVAFGLLIAGCVSVDVENRTPRAVAANASGIYPLRLHLNMMGGVEKDSVRARVVVDGRTHPMAPAHGAMAGDFTYDYRMPEGRSSVAFYFDVDYTQRQNGSIRHRSSRTPLQQMALSNRYVLGLDTGRGVAGTAVTAIGRGFSEGDLVWVGEVPAETHYESPTSLRFFIPSLPSGHSYRLTVVDDEGRIAAGKFFIDVPRLGVVPQSLKLSVGEKATLTLSIPTPAPEDLSVEISTDVPDAIAAGEAVIPSGRTSTGLTIEPLEPAQGTLVLSIPGFQDVRVPVNFL